MNNLERMTLELIGENTDSPDVFTDDSTGMAQIRDSLNDAIEEISMVTGGTAGSYSIILQENAGFYRLNFSRDRLGWVTDAWLRGQRRRLEQTDLTRLNKFNPRWMQNTGSPNSYFPIGKDVIGIWPRPTSTDIIQLDCVVIPSRYTLDTDRIKLRDNFQKAAVNYAVSEYWASRGDAKTALWHLQKYTERVGLDVQYPLSNEQIRQLQTQKAPWPRTTGG